MMSIFETISCCRICQSPELQEVLDLGLQPPANSFFQAGDPRPPEIPLRLLFCQACFTIQINTNVDPGYLFSKYIWVTGTSSAALEYSHRFVKEALARCEKKAPFVVEIASNDGTFLRSFKSRDCRVLGIDPATNIAEFATEHGVPTLAEFFSKELASQLAKEYKEIDLVIARNVIPHVKNIHSVIEGIAVLLGAEGVGAIEFHDCRLIQEMIQYDYIYHEHLFYFSLQSIQGLLKRHQLYTFDLIRSPISGGSWVVYFSKSQHPKSHNLIDAENAETEKGTNTPERWQTFSGIVEAHKEKLKEIVLSQQTPVLAYGASARSSTLLNYCDLDYNWVDSVIDKNPLKQGLLMPGSEIPVISYRGGVQKAEGRNRILLLAWNFQNEIVDELRRSGYLGKFIIPLPGLPVIQ
jgi:hypothetical protein